jgi:hypothetical protein
MDVPMFAEILKTAFSGGFHGGPDELYGQLVVRKDFRSLPFVPSQARFLDALKMVAPQTQQHGVEIRIAPTGMIDLRVLAGPAVERLKAQGDEEARAKFFANSAEGASLRAEFGNGDDGWTRYCAYRRGVSTGQIHPPRIGKNVLAAEDKATNAKVDPRLSLEAQCRQRWELEPETRKKFTSYEAFEAYERASSRGAVRVFGGAVA